MNDHHGKKCLFRNDTVARARRGPPLAVAMLIASPAVGLTAWAEQAPRQPRLPELLVIATTLLPGPTIDIDKVPGNVESLLDTDLTGDGAASLTAALNTLGGINVNDTLTDPFQPDILFRGFEASPIVGTPQGLAVYQNGVRINEAFGDTVNWDLFPDIAINRVDIVSDSPVYGLNALGGAITINMKNGFNYQGAQGELSCGSFDQRAGSAQFGANDGSLGFYAAARILNQGGWRLFSHDSVRQMYGAFSARVGRAVVDLSYSHADNQLYGQGAAPVQELAVSPKLVFTGPQNNFNRLDSITIDASYSATHTLSLQSVFYYRNFRQSVSNGNKTNYAACVGAQNIGSLCQSDGGTPLVNAAGAALPDISNGGANTIGENDFENIRSVGLGGSFQASDTRPLFGRGNHFSAGATIDSARIDFTSGVEIGVIGSSLIVSSSGLFVDTPENTPFSATPVSLNATNGYYGFYAADTFDVTPAFAVTASGRYNIAQIDLSDRRGTSLSGRNRYSHFNPALGGTYKLSTHLTAYAGYSSNNRAPTASEIECSDPRKPCLLPANLASDPPNLKQVAAQTYEVGLRGKRSAGTGAAGFAWNISAFRTTLADDIYAVATSISSGFFRNIGSTRRQGIEASLSFRGKKWSAYANYSYVDATFRSALTVNSPSNPFRDANGNTMVQPGNHLPGIPDHRLKAGADYDLLPNWMVGGTLTIVSSAYYRGDVSNQNGRLVS